MPAEREIDAASPAAPEATSERVLAEISRVLRGELQLEREVRPEDDLAADLNLDSVSLLTLVVELENTFRVALNEEDAAQIHTVAELAALVVTRAHEAQPQPGVAGPAHSSSI
jgi:acyl carrier protein